MRCSRVAFLVTVTATLATPVLGQSRLERVEQLTRLGRAEEARVELMDWWTGDRAEASRRELQRGLWLRGRLTVDPVQAELDFQRLAVLYPSGQFTADAMLRLAQSAFATGDEAAARAYVATLVRDYPRTDARETAEAWLASAGPVPPVGDTPRRMIDESPADEVDSDTAEVAARVDEERVEAVEEVPEADAEPVMNYYVQLGAFADEERAFALFEEVQEAGVEVRVVRVEGSLFTHVRVGRFAEREDAVDKLDDLTAAGISAALVRDDRAEETIRD
jgi:cell division septation protein DedD